MIQKISTYLFIGLTALSAGSSAAADEQQVVDLTPYWDSAVSSLLLAAGMYGADDKRANDEQQSNMQLSLNQSEDLYKNFSSDHNSLSGQDITLSYSGSSGRLGISAGYLYTGVTGSQCPESFLLDLKPLEEESLENKNPWYFTLNMSKSFQVSDHFAVGMGSRAMVMNTQFAEPPSHTVSMLLNLPLSYKNFFTITPELQWSRSLPTADSSAGFDETSNGSVYSEEDVFYGGMSISFSY